MRAVCHSHKGFTLVELLIALSIVVILAGSLLPVYARARGKVRQTVCLSHERQLGLALAMYAQDYEERFPGGTTGSMGQGWAGQVLPYVKHTDLYQCPEDDDKGEEPNEGQPKPGLKTVSYALNSNITAASLSAFSAPGVTLLLFEVNDAGADFADAHSGPDIDSPTGRGLPQDNCPVHCGKPFGADYYATGNLGGVEPPLSTTKRPYHDPVSNYLLADGHVKAVPGDSVSPGRNAPSSSASQSSAPPTAAGTECLMLCPGRKAALTFSVN